MRSSFFEFQVASSGLYAAKTGLNVISHNIANANTVGFSRQVLNQTASRPIALNTGKGMVGTGTDVVSINRMRDEYLDDRYRTQNAALGEFAVKGNELGAIEALFNEPSDSGISAIMNEFYSALQEVSKNPGDMAARQSVKQKALQFTQYFNNASTALQNAQRDLENGVKNKVNQVNTLTKQIANLNQQIYSLELQGNPGNDLKDQRDELIDQLSKVVDIKVNTVQSGNSNQLFITLGNGQPLVSHFNYRELDYVQNNNDPITGVPNLSSVVWKDDGTQASISSMGGELEAYLDLRDGTGQGATPDKGVPYYMNKLNKFCQNFAMAFNEGKVPDPQNPGNYITLTAMGGHTSGKDKNGNPGLDFFVGAGLGTPLDYTQIKAGNFGVNQAILDDVSKICTSTTGSESDNNLILGLINQRHNDKMYTEGKPEDFMSAIFTELAVDKNYADRFVTNQKKLIDEIEYQRQSVSSVDLNEEMTNMVKYQQTYNAAAKMINTIDQIYNVMINQLGK